MSLYCLCFFFLHVCTFIISFEVFFLILKFWCELLMLENITFIFKIKFGDI